MDELAGTSRLVFLRTASLALILATITLAGCGGQSTSPAGPSKSVPSTGGSTSPSTPPVGPTVVLAGAGDIARCDSSLTNAHATASLLGSLDGRIFTAGDNTQDVGSMNEFTNCFGPTWGRYRSRIFPTPGNHDYQTAGGAAYHGYFGDTAGPAGLGYYSYTWGSWHVVALNSNLSMKAGSPQAEWLWADLDANDSACTIAYWHHPLFTSGPNGNNAAVRDAWSMLYDHDAEIVVNGHDHIYERFAPQDPLGRADAVGGIRQFTVGTGGAALTRVARLQANSEAQGIAWGVLKLTLRSNGYDWQFISVPGGHFSDAGSGTCH